MLKSIKSIKMMQFYIKFEHGYHSFIILQRLFCIMVITQVLHVTSGKPKRDKEQRNSKRKHGC